MSSPPKNRLSTISAWRGLMRASSSSAASSARSSSACVVAGVVARALRRTSRAPRRRRASPRARRRAASTSTWRIARAAMRLKCSGDVDAERRRARELEPRLVDERRRAERRARGRRAGRSTASRRSSSYVTLKRRSRSLRRACDLARRARQLWLSMSCSFRHDGFPRAFAQCHAGPPSLGSGSDPTLIPIRGACNSASDRPLTLAVAIGGSRHERSRNTRFPQLTR